MDTHPGAEDAAAPPQKSRLAYLLTKFAREIRFDVFNRLQPDGDP